MPKGHPALVLTCAVVRAEFIDALIALRSVKLAYIRCGINVKSLYLARRTFPDFADAWVAARDGVVGNRLRVNRSLSAPVRARFLAAIASGVAISRAARQANIANRTFYYVRSRDAGFAAAWHQARAVATEELESVLIERVIHGVEKTVLVDGVAHKIRYFDMAAGIKLLERRAAAEPGHRRGRFIELTPEAVALARRKVVALLTEQGVTAFDQ